MFAVTCRTLRILTVTILLGTSEMCIYYAFHRCAVATFGHVRLSTLPQVILARLELLVSTHFNGRLRGL